MKLWVRSQNKKRLIKVDIIEFDKQIDGPAIIFSHEYMLGEYSTKERALEVLDEIQEILCPKKPKTIIGKNVEFVPALIYVYEMPEK